MKRKMSVLVFFILLIGGCHTITDNVIENTIGTEDYKKIEEIDLLILEYRIKKEPADLSLAKEKLEELMTNKAYNKEYEAVLYGYAGEIDYYMGNIPGLKENFKEVEKRSTYVDYYYILSALLEREYEIQIEILKQGIPIAHTTGKIKLYLALFYFETGDFINAAASFDDAFENLHPTYVEYYEKNRELAYQLIDNPQTDAEAQTLLEQETVTFSHVISLTLMNTDFLQHITVDKDADPGKLLDTLKEYGYIHTSTTSPESICPRKDIAFFLISIVAYMENKPDLKEKYQNQFIANGMESPVPDVKVEDYYFSAVLVLVEKEIMELPNGIHFLPHKTMSGIECNELLKKVYNKYY
jgi:tetratricopeptide (TPR) repeat protein